MIQIETEVEKNTNEIPKAIVSIHLAHYGNNCSDPDDVGSVASFEFAAKDQGTTDNNDLPGAETPTVNSEFGDNNINENVVTGDNDDDDDDGNDDDNIKAITMSSDNKDDNSEGEDQMSDNDNTNSTTNPTNIDPTWMSLLVVTDDDGEDDPGDYNEFCFNYDLDVNSIFDNDNTDNGEGYVCMRVIDSWLSLEEIEYKDNDILLCPGVFDVSENISIHPSFFNGILHDSFGCPYINDDPISNIQILPSSPTQIFDQKEKGCRR